jgi:hypothetical protein
MRLMRMESPIPDQFKATQASWLSLVHTSAAGLAAGTRREVRTSDSAMMAVEQLAISGYASDSL